MVKNLSANAEDIRDVGLIPESEDPLEEELATHSSTLARNIHGQRSLAGSSSWVAKSQIQLIDCYSTVQYLKTYGK